MKTKGFTRKSEALKRIGGGENRTLVLSKIQYNHYMLISFFKSLPPTIRASVGVSKPYSLENTNKGLSYLIPDNYGDSNVLVEQLETGAI